MTLHSIWTSLKEDWEIIKIDIAGGETIIAEVRDANVGVTDPAEWVTNAAKAIVANETKLPSSWQGVNLEKAVIKFLTKLESGVTEAEVEGIVKTVIANRVASAAASSPSGQIN